MSALFATSAAPLACGSSSDFVAVPASSTGDASDGLLRRDDSAEIPCEPRRILTTICQQCHTRPETRNGAPFPLQYRSDILATYGGMQVRELMIEQLEAGRMPLAPVMVDPIDRERLLIWLRAGAPAVSPTTCVDAADVGDASHRDGSVEANATSDGGSDAGSDFDAACGDCDAHVEDQ